MKRHRTTARGVLFLLCLLGLAAAAAAASAQNAIKPGGGGKVQLHAPPPKGKRIVFPVIGKVQYTDDFGDPRPIGTEQGTDMMTPRHSLAIAAESGKVQFWTDSGAGCMLNLYGKSGTTYVYLHLNNDKTSHNDNRGKCGPRMSYAPHLRNGAHVTAGQVIGFTGDSGNANGIPHLEFQVHPHGGKTRDPYRILNRARRLLFSALKERKGVRVVMSGTVVSTADNQSLTMRVTSLEAWPGRFHIHQFGRDVTVYVPSDAAVSERIKGGRGASSTVSLADARKGQGVTVTTSRQPAKLSLFLGQPLALSAAEIMLAAPK
jgi:hypothetical protein